MSRPRKPFGVTHPGRLPATMIKVLAAEMSDPARLRRGKQYARDGSVLDIMIEAGYVTVEVQGSRPTPYIASVEVSQGSGMPLRRDITCSCTCPDDDNWDGHACKHVVAALFTLSNEFLLEPELLDVWRNQTAGSTTVDDDSANGDEDATPTRGARRHLSVVRDIGEDDRSDDSRVAAAELAPEDPLRAVLQLPPGTELPDIPILEPADLRLPKDRDVASALREALLHVHVDWD